MHSPTLLHRVTRAIRSFAGPFNGNLAAVPLALMALAWPQGARAAANFVYHERTGNNPGCGAVAYAPVLNPTSAQAYDLRFKVECQFGTDRLRVYYTTDGSTPSGAFGTPGGTTAVVSGSYLCTFFDALPSCTVDVCGATLPAQPAGTVVKYIVSAWKDLDGPEIFANSGTCGTCTPADDSSEATVFQYTVGSETDLYWDANGATAGAGGPTPTGAWGTDSFWSSVFDGTAATGGWIGGLNAIFSAGNDATGVFTVTLDGAQSAGLLSVEEGNVTLSGATPSTNLTLNGQVNVASGASANLNVLLSGSSGLIKSGAGLLSLNNTNNFTGNINVTAGTLAVGSSASAADTYLGAIPGAFNQTAVTLQEGATLRLNAQIVTFAANRGLTIAGAGANLDANAGAILFFPNVVDGSGATVTKTGAGEVGFYGAANTFAKLIIDQGNLRIGQSTFAGSDLSYGALPSVFTPDAITIRNGATNRVVGSAAVTIHTNRGITLGPGGGVFRNDVSPVSLTINSAITGPGGLRKEGGQAFTLNGERSYEGATVINGGGTSVSSPLSTFNGPGTGTGPLFMNSGRLTLNHANAYSAVTMAGGRIDANTNGSLGTGTVTISPTNNILLVNATTLGVGPVTNVTLNNDIIINPGTTLAGAGVTIDLAANSGRELILNGKVSGAGLWKKDNSGSTGTLVLGNPANDFTATLTNFAGTLMVAADNALGATSGGTHINSGGSLAFRGGLSGINYTAPEPITLSGLGRFTGGAISNETGNNSFSGPITLVGDGSVGGMIGTTLTLNEAIGETGGARLLYKLGAGTVKLNAPAGNTYTGGTIISNGVLVACNLTGSATGPGPVTIYPPGALAGPGSIAGDLTVNGILSPGASPGTLDTSNEIWNGGGSYVWEINDVDAGQGTDPGWDLVNITGTLTINATAGSKFNIDITSLTLANAPGNVADFDNTTDYVWTILKTTGGITGFDPAAFNLLTSNFSNPLGAGLFLIETANGGNDLVLRFVRAPAIAVQPAPQVAECATGSATFAVSATGTAPLTYQWRFNGADLGGATAATLTINPTTPATAGNYDVVVANAYGTVTSSAATLTLVDTTAPTITTCAPGQTLSANANCQAAIPDLTGSVVAGDTCGPVTISQSPIAGTLVGLGAHTVTLTVLDAANNPATCNATVTVNDTTPPTITACAANQSVTATLAGCQAMIPDLTSQVTATDNCPGAVIVTQSPLAGSLAGVGPTLVTLTATDAAGNPATCQATVTVNSGVTVTVNSATICGGGSATLTATTAAASPTYLWSPGGATTASITVSPTETTVYTVTVTDGVTGCTGNGSGTVTIAPSLVVTVNSATLCAGGSAVLTASTEAVGPTYLWSPGGETTASITVSPAVTTVYMVTVTDGGGCTGIGSGTVTVNPLPTVSVNSETICAGTSATLTATHNAANPSFLWSPGGATTASIMVSPAVMTTYTVTVTDGVTTCANSASGTVSVTPLPTVSVNSETVCAGVSTTLTATTSAANPTYSWSPGGATTASINVSPTETTVYTVTVTDTTTTCANSASGTVTVNPSPTVTVNSPSICPGDSATLAATTSAANPTYLWSPGGETTASITVSPVATTTYSVTVTDGVTGCTGNGSGTVTVRAAETFANTSAIALNDFAAASPYPSVINVSGLTAAVCRVTVTLNNLSHDFPDDIDIVLIAPNGQGVLLLSDVGGANPVTGLTLTLDDTAAGSLPDSGLLTSGTYKPTNIGAKSDNRPDNFPPPVPAVNFVTNLSALAGLDPNGAWSLYVFDDELVDVGSMGGGWSIALTTLTPIADLTVAQTPIPNPVGVGSNLTFNVTVSNLGPAGADAVSLTDTLPAGMTFVSAAPSQGSCSEAAGVVTCALGSLAANASATVAIIVVPTGAGAGNNVATVTAATLDLVAVNNTSSAGVTVLDPPMIVTGPASQTVCADQSALFTVTATGAAPLSHQWYLNDVAIGGATAASYSIANAQAADAGTYKVIVSNPVGAAEASATLTVNPLPTVAVNSETICVGQSATLTATTSAANPSYLWSPGGATTASITVNPASTTIYTVLVTDGVTGCTNSASGTITVKQLTTATALTSVNNLCPGSPASFSTTASGDGPFSYVWRKDGTLLGETSPTLNIAAVTPADAGTYSVEVTGFCNSVTNSATLTVVAPPTITAQPQNQITPMGNGAAFSVTATGTGPITYQWLLNGSPILGSNGTSITVSNVTLSQNGHTYSVIVSNCAGPVTSLAAVLTVTPIAGISFDFDTPLQFTNAPYYLTYNNWLNGSFVIPPIATFEAPIGGTGPYPGSGSLDLIPNNGSENSILLLPVSFDFSIPGKTLFASTMVKIKNPVANNRNTQFGFVTATNLGVNDQTPQGFATVILQSTAQPAPTYELRHQRRTTGGGLQESTLTGTASLVVSNWYKLNIALTNTRTALNSNYAVAATLQDMGPQGTTPGATVLSFVTTTNNADIVNFKNVYLALRGFENTGVENRDNTYVWTTAGDIFFVQQPQNQTVLQGRRAVFKGLVDGEGPYTYQWQRSDGSGGFTNIPGARSWNLILPPARLSDGWSQFRVVVNGPANTITSAPASLTVTPESLSVVSAGSVDGTTVGVLFSQPVEAASAENPASYLINGSAPVQARIYRSSLGALGPEGIYVVLTPGSVLAGAFTVSAPGVQDLSGGAASGTVNGQVAGLTGFDVNPLVTGPPGENYSFGPGQFIVTGGGVDIFGTADSFRYVYTTKTGDFDFVVKIPYMDAVRFVSKAAIDVRTTLDPFSPNVLAGFNPGPIAEGSGTLRQFTEGNIRHTYNAASAGWGANVRLFPPDVWVRFRRVGNTFLRYSSGNGTTWALDGQISPSPVMPDTLYFGLAVCSVRNLQPESAQFENFGPFAGYAGAAIVINTQPSGATVNAGSAASISGLSASVNGGGIPAQGELAVVWQRDDGTGGFTNMPTAGATNQVLSLGTVFASDNGAQFRAVLMAPGATPVTSSVVALTVNDAAAPTLTSANAAVLPSYPVSEVVLNFSEPLTAASATDISNYTVTNAAGVRLTVLSAAFLHGDPRTVILKVDGQLGSGNASVGVSGVRDLNNNALATTVRSFRSFLPSTAPVVVEVYQDIGNATDVASLTGHALFTGGTPTFITYSNLFGFNVVNNFTSSQDNYGVKVYTYFVPSASGAVKFWIRSDDAMQLFLNTNAVNSTDPAGRVLITANAGANNNYTVGSAPVSTNITLVGGQAYYMEALLKEGAGGDGFSVATTAPTVNTAPGTGTFIPTANLAYPASAAPSTPVVMDVYTGYQNFLAGFNQLAGLTQATNFPTGNYAIDTVNYKYIAGVPDVIGYQKYFGVQPVTLGNTRLDNYLGRLQSYFIPPSTGLYRFWMAVDDVGHLYMNTNAVNSTDPAGMVLLGTSANAFVSTASQLVAQNVPLIGGQRYYMMALWREGGGGDGIRLAVRPQSDASTPPTTEIIPASMLEYPLEVGRAGMVNFGGIAPLNPTVVDGRSIALSAYGIVGAPPYGFIWLKNGVRVLDNSFTNVTPPLTLADNGAVYTLIVTNPFSRMERSVTVTVLPDGTTPTIVRTVGRRYNDGFTIQFSEPMDATSATYLGNYAVSGGLALRSATLDPTRTMVSFETGPQLPNTTYTITLNGVRDASSTANAIAPNTMTSFSTWSVGGSGFLVEIYTNIAGTAVADLTGTPKFAANLPDVVYYTNFFGMGAFGANSGLENWGGRITGYFVPTNTGYYRFYVRSDDASQLWMNINSADSENPAGRTMLIHMPNANISMQDPRAISPPVFLNQGQRYYIEGLVKEGGGGDYFLATFRSTDANGTAVGVVPPVDTVAELQPASAFDGAPGDPGAIQIVQTPPSDLFVVENEQVSLSLVASIPANILRAVAYQWQKFDGAAYTNIPGATASTLSFFANLSDDLAQYRLVFSAPGRNASYVTTLHVSPDGQAPYIVSASSLDGRTIGLCFNERLFTPNAVDNFNYTVNGGANNVTLAEQRPDLRSVVLHVDPPISGAFTVSADFQRDLATSPNEGSSATNGVVQGYNAPADIGGPTVLGSSFSCVEGEIDVIAGGADIWSTADQGHLTLATRKGDFDVHVRVQTLTRSGADTIAKAGLMVRENMDAGSRTMNYLVNPPATIGGRNIYEAAQRPSLNAATAAWAGGADSAAPANIPDAWIRIKREGALFIGYRSTNGIDWVLTTTNVMPMSNSVLVGFATTAHNNAGPAVLAEYRNIHLPLPPTILVQPAPAAQTIALGGSTSYSVVVSNRPNSGPLRLQWRKNGVVIPGATSATLTLNNLSGADAGTYTVVAANDGGEGDESIPVVLTVANGLPLVGAETLVTTQGMNLTVTSASLLANDMDPENAPLSLLGVNGVCSSLVRADFETGLPPNSAIYSGGIGGASIDVSGGTGNSRVLKLTQALISQSGSILFDDLGAGAALAGFTANFNLRIGDASGEPADGFSLNFAGDLPIGPSTPAAAENGGGTGFSFCIDNYRFAPYPGGGTANTSGMKIRYGGVDIAGVQMPTWNSTAYIPVSITLAPDGTLTVLVNGTNVFGNLVLPYVPAPGRFGIYARTGGQFQTHWLDDLSITPVYRTPNGGLVSLDSDSGNITYTPPAGYCGLDSFVYLVNDGQQGGTSCGVVTVRVIESTLAAPTIGTCATNRMIVAQSATPIPLPDLTGEVVAADNCCCVTITQSPAAGTLIGPGATTVTLTATDVAGLTATCQATVAFIVPTTLSGASHSGSAFSASFQTANGLQYTVQYTDDLNTLIWTTLTTVTGDGTLKSFTDPGPLPPYRFYRVSVAP